MLGQEFIGIAIIWLFIYIGISTKMGMGKFFVWTCYIFESHSDLLLIINSSEQQISKLIFSHCVC